MALTAEQQRFLEARRFAVLGTVGRDGVPHLTLVWYLLDGDEIVINTRVGRVKDRNLRRDPRASLLVYDDDGYQYIRVEGRVRPVEDRAVGQRDIRRLAERYYEDRGQVERAVRETWSKQERITYRLPTTRVYEYRD